MRAKLVEVIGRRFIRVPWWDGRVSRWARDDGRWLERTFWICTPCGRCDGEVDDEIVEASVELGGGEGDVEGLVGCDGFGSGDVVEGAGRGEEGCESQERLEEDATGGHDDDENYERLGGLKKRQ